MYPFWDTVINPLILASDARRIVEIGALRGETTAKMLDDLRPDAELHIIDPLPQFDPTEHEEAFPGRYIFHRALSLAVLPTAPAFDVALIDGDHNWYTVYNECRELAAGARRADQPLPMMILHDVGWPYGRRDLYYNPSDVPQEFRQPHAKKGMTPGRAKLLPGGGMNITLDNAIEEGGERNGVRTGLDDWVAEHDRPLRQVILPIYFGLAIVAEEDYLDAHPEVKALLDQIESPQGTADLLELSEQIRLEGVVFEHNIERMRNDTLSRANNRYLSLLRGALLDEHYIENEERIDYLLTCVNRGVEVDPEQLRAPAKLRAKNLRTNELQRDTGATVGPRDTGHFAYAPMGRERLEQLDESIEALLGDGVAGDFVDVGVSRGGAAIYMRGVLDAREITDRTVWVADAFRASPKSGARSLQEAGTADLWSDLNQVRDGFARFDLLDDQVRFLQGDASQTLPEADIEQIAMLRIGRGLGVETGATLAALYDKVVPGGVVIIDDESDDDTRAAVEAFRTERGIADFDRVAWSGTAWRKADETVPNAPASVGVRHRAPLAPKRPNKKAALDLSIVANFYNMSREAERTLHSLSRSYQRDIEDLKYEVLVIDNGSTSEHALTESFVESFGPEFRLIPMGDNATSSPTHGINTGILQTQGELVGMMIDGAHVLSPGVLRHAISAAAAYGPTVVATQQWYVGPGQQPALGDTYTQAEEDALFEAINWPSDGYRLFEISHFIGERDWFDGIFESNCLFAPRSLIEQVGGFDDSYDMAGGGYTNLEIYERLAGHPDTTLTTIMGEGSFHQVHGGTTTNDTAVDGRRAKTFGYAEHYTEKMGRPLSGPARQLHYVGSFVSNDSRRTRSRRMTASAFNKGRASAGVDGPPEVASRIPDELNNSFVEAYWHSLGWKEQTWLGQPVTNAPTDLVTYQELVTSIRPDHIVVTSRADTGTAHFFASVCDLLGHGQVIAVGPIGQKLGDHPRVTHVSGNPADDDTIAAVLAEVGDNANAIVVLGSANPAPKLQAEFEAYSPLVKPGSYVIFENTIYNGRPVWPGYGPAATDAIRRLLGQHGDFMQDSDIERHGLTFNPGGFLRRSE